MRSRFGSAMRKTAHGWLAEKKREQGEPGIVKPPILPLEFSIVSWRLLFVRLRPAVEQGPTVDTHRYICH